jgi:pimeloyl-ACP methyl ester carboxylesterase
MKDLASSADGNRVHFEVDGVGEPALVFVHGWSCDRTYWGPQMEHFAARYQVVAMDLAGHGESSMDREEWTMARFGADVVAVVEKLDLGRLVLIGHSMGGDVIIEAGLRLPERLAGLVWVDVYRTLVARTRVELEEFLDPFRRDFVAATKGLVHGMFPAGSDPTLVGWVAADMSAAPRDLALDALEHAVENLEAVLAGLPKLTAPLVAINPDYLPTDMEGLRRQGVKAVIMPGVGHFPMMEDPDAFNRLLAETIAEFEA